MRTFITQLSIKHDAIRKPHYEEMNNNYKLKQLQWFKTICSSRKFQVVHYLVWFISSMHCCTLGYCYLIPSLSWKTVYVIRCKQSSKRTELLLGYLHFQVFLSLITLLTKWVTCSRIHFVNNANEVLWGANEICIIIRNKNSVYLSII